MRTIERGTPLTPREREALLCICADGLTYEGAAERMGIERATVCEFARRAFARLGAHSIAAACFRLGVHGAQLAAVKRREERVA